MFSIASMCGKRKHFKKLIHIPPIEREPTHHLFNHPSSVTSQKFLDSTPLKINMEPKKSPKSKGKSSSIHLHFGVPAVSFPGCKTIWGPGYIHGTFTIFIVRVTVIMLGTISSVPWCFGSQHSDNPHTKVPPLCIIRIFLVGTSERKKRLQFVHQYLEIPNW